MLDQFQSLKNKYDTVKTNLKKYKDKCTQKKEDKIENKIKQLNHHGQSILNIEKYSLTDLKAAQKTANAAQKAAQDQ